ncbi:mechanosensitive ion channel protein 1, mitochondrial-like isoform X1 [Rutidosis leptorrhynchoides]|uniref:mechanosensitive ion channel protein 1, mitochondrial-like isoform X1 n=1 Tax=Rutidosis leptorrhynchoides TaxID=125765 RepID=UPI003A99E0FC
MEGRVTRIGLITTSLLRERRQFLVFNSLFSKQITVVKSRSGWRAMTSKIFVPNEDMEKIGEICEDITIMLKSRDNVFLGRSGVQPYCYLTEFRKSFAELTYGCSIKQETGDEEELFSAEQRDINAQCVAIILKHRATSVDLSN